MDILDIVAFLRSQVELFKGLAMHIDTDEANAANIATGMTGYIDSIQSRS